VTVLRRLQIGPFGVEEAVPLDAEADTARGKLLPMAAAVNGLPIVRVTTDEAGRLRHGQTITAVGGGEVAILDEFDGLVGVGTVTDGRLKPEKVMGR
jgi:tRNA U55 pseudouridine synthase TruB